MGAKHPSSMARALGGVMFRGAFAQNPNNPGLAKAFPDRFKAAGGQVPGEVIPETSAGNEGIGKPPSAATSTLATAKPVEPARRRAGPTTSTNKRPGSAKKTLLGA